MSVFDAITDTVSKAADVVASTASAIADGVQKVVAKVRDAANKVVDAIVEVGIAVSKAVEYVFGKAKQVFAAVKAFATKILCTKPTPKKPPGSLTFQEAKQWFDDFKNDKSIPWDYPNDCCYNRAEVMARKLNAAGVKAGKVWNYAPTGPGAKPLKVNTPNDPKGYVEWGYHVAPTVPVVQPDGTVVPMVMDPSIADKPITPQEWKDMQSQPASKLVPTDSAPFYRSEDGRVSKTPSDGEIQQIFDGHRADRASNWSR